MKLLILRKYFPDYTEGKIYVNDHCYGDTLEDPKREMKVYGDTCIPEGTYEVIIDFSNRFKRRMIHVLNVPEFEGVRIHAGNTKADTHGCPLVGIRSGPGKLMNSRDKMSKLFDVVDTAFKNNEYIELTIKAL